MEELSVIVPVYNGEKQISICLDSILNQTNIRPEIIIVNDSSTDGTLKIIEYYAHIAENIKIVNMAQNSGPGICRNKGIDLASGKYIGFIDSDDWVDLNFYYTLLSAIKSQDCDIAIAGITDEYNNSASSSLRYHYSDPAIVDGKTALRLMTKSYNLGMFITPIMNNKIYRTEYIRKNNIRCCQNKSWQDDYFSFFAILHSKKVCFVPRVEYHYYQHTLSITHNATSFEAKIDNCIDVLVQIREELYIQDIYSLYEKEYQAFVERCITSLLVMLRRGHQLSLNEGMTYLFEKIIQNFQPRNLISYLDSERIYKFFNL